MVDQETLNIFDELYYETYQDILKYVICNCKNIDDVKDIVQNVYLEALKKIKYNKDINAAYIMGIAKHKVKDYYRFKYKIKLVSLFTSKNEESDLFDVLPGEINIELDTINKENIKFIWNYLRNKKIIIQQIFYLYYYIDYSIKNIAEELNISESNVKNYLYRTLKELNNLLNKGGDENE